MSICLIVKEGIKLKKNSFIYSTIILVISNFLVRLLGFIYKIFLSRHLGSEGIGLFHLVFHTFLVLITITSSGIPVAVSKIIAQKKSLNDYKGCKATLTISIFLGFTISIFLSFLLFYNIDFIINHVVKSYKLYESLFALIPAIPIVTLSSILRGYYYGIKNVKPAAVSQVWEQILRVSFVMGILYFIPSLNLRYSVTVATLGVTIGELGGLILLIFNLRSTKVYIISSPATSFKNLSSKNIPLFLNILAISLPITITRLVSVLTQSANMFLVPRRLQLTGLDLNQSVSAFGEVVGMTFPLLFLPFVVTSALVVNIIPNVSEEKALKNWNRIRNKSLLALRVALLISIPIAFVFLFFSKPLCMFLYGKPNVGIYLKHLSITVIFLSLHHIIGGILHGMGKQILTTINYLIGMGIHFICIYFLIPVPKIGIHGFNIGFILSSVIIFLLNFYSLRKYLYIKLELFNHILKPILASIVMILFIKFTMPILSNLLLSDKLSLILSNGLGGIIYFIIIFATGSIKIKTFISLLLGDK